MRGYATVIETTIFEGTNPAPGDNGVGEIGISSDIVAGLTAGDVLEITLTESSEGRNYKVVYKGKNGNWDENNIPSIGGNSPWVNGNETTSSIAFTADDISAMSGHGIYLYNGSGIISKVVIKKNKVFTDGVADLSMFEASGAHSYNAETHAISVTTGYDGNVKLSIPERESIKGAGKEVKITFDIIAQVKVSYKYDGGSDMDIEDTEGIITIPLTDSNNLTEIRIQGATSNQVITLLGVEIVDAATPSALSFGDAVTLYEHPQGLSVSWKNICGKGSDWGNILETGEVMKVTISATKSDTETYKKIFITKSDGSTQVEGSEVSLNEVTNFPYAAEIPLTATMVSNMTNGFYICGDGITIKKVELTKPYYTLTTSVSNGSIAISPESTDNGKYIPGTAVTLTATATNTDGYEFDKWTDGTNELTTSSTNVTSINDNVLTIAMNSDMAVTATFKKKTFAVTASSSDASKGSVSFSSGSSGSSYDYDTEVVLTATAEEGNVFVKWTDGTNDLTTDLAYVSSISGNTLTLIVKNAINVTAVFAAIDTKDVKLSEFGGDSGVDFDSSTGVFTTTNGYKGISEWIGYYSNVSGSKLVVKTASEADFKIAVYYTDGSSVSTDSEGASTINSAKTIYALSLDNTKYIQSIAIQLKAAGTATITSIALDPTYTLTKRAENGNFTVSTDGGRSTTDATTFAHGAELTLTAEPATGYKFVNWKIDGSDAGATTTITHTMTADVTISPIFEEKAGLLAEGETRLLWANTDGVALTWSSYISLSDEIGEILEEKENLIFTVKVTGNYGQFEIVDTNYGGIEGASMGGLVNGENKLALTAAMIEKMAGGFKIKGDGATITKIELYKPETIKRLSDEETKVLWSNSEGTVLSWNTVDIERAAEWGAVLEEDERIIISVKAKDANCEWPKVALSNSDSSDGSINSTSNLLNDLTMPTELTIALTAEMVSKMKNGFSITGDGATITKAVLYKPTMPAKTVHTLNSTETAISGDANVTVPAAKFANISAYDVLTVNFAITASPAKVILKGNGENGGWDYLKEMEFKSGETLFALPLTPAMTSNLKKNGLQITGSGYTFKSVGIKTAGEVPSDEEKKDDDDEETIIDEKTGEADLTVLSAQDDSKTTLTENEDGSITMTTTEPYCAAQIWFNDPEPVAGNVLKVELAESSVNVTVTVKYTDGTESQMSANTMVAKARGETRSASGTTVEVPLESGKEVQNIEVKNNVAGTITIKKMQVTTVNVFTNGVANLSMLKPQSNATYDTAAHTLATTKGWTGATISPVANENVSGKELLIEFADASKVKVAVKYRTDVEGPSTIMEKAAKAVRLALDNSKNIQEISIQPTEAAIVTFTKIAVNSEETDDGSLKPGKTITLWENAAGETLAWNEVAKQDASVGETLKEYDELLITVSGVTKDCDWPKVFIRDASSEQAGNEVLLNDVGSFPYTVRIVLTGEMAQQLSKGFSICGDGVTVTKLQVYRPEAPKPGDIHLADLNYGYNSSYDKGTHTITTTARWAARGWEIGDKRYNDKNLITVKFEAVDFPVTLKMEYTTGLQTAQATSVGVPAGRTELLLEIPSGISKLNRVYIIYENPGSVKLTEASVTYQDNLKLSTAIKAFEADGVIRDGRYDSDGWYNLRGMRIPEPKTSGVYIHGGKKVVIY